MAVFEYDTLDLPGTAALDPEKTLKDIGVTLTKEDIIEAGGEVVPDEGDDDGTDTTDDGTDTTGTDTTNGGEG